MSRIVDFHCHILPPSFPDRHEELAMRDSTYSELFPQPGARMATAESLMEAMRQAGVAHSVALGFGWTDLELARETNDYLIQAVDRHSEQLTGFCTVNPAWGDRALEEVERCVSAGLRGIGELHPDTQGFDISDITRMSPMMELARSLKLPVLVHTSEPVGHHYPGKGKTTPDRVYRFVKNFPGNTIVCAHWGGGLPFYGLMPEIPEELRNVYFDTAASPFLYRPEIFATVAGIIGPERILFGTDYPLLRHRRILEQVDSSGLDDLSKSAILGGNAEKLLGLETDCGRS